MFIEICFNSETEPGRWEALRKEFPKHWLLLEALRAHSLGQCRIIDLAALIGAYDCSRTAYIEFLQLNSRDPLREIYIVDTTQELKRHLYASQSSPLNYGKSTSIAPHSPSSTRAVGARR